MLPSVFARPSTRTVGLGANASPCAGRTTVGGASSVGASAGVWSAPSAGALDGAVLYWVGEVM